MEIHGQTKVNVIKTFIDKMTIPWLSIIWTAIKAFLKAIFGKKQDPNAKERKKIVKKDLPKALKSNDVTKRTKWFLRLKKKRKK